MTLKRILVCGTAVACLAIGSADAATINLVDLGGVTGSVAAKDFNIAASYWGHMFTNNATIDLGVAFNALPPNVIGSTGSTRQDYLVSDWAADVTATKSTDTLDTNIVLPTLNVSGGISAILNGVGANGTTSTAVSKQHYSQGQNYSDYVMFLNTSVVKAVGGVATYDETNNPDHLDGSVQFSSDFAFDFDATDGIDGDKIDFLAVAIHEIGHALGFVSGVDYEDIYGTPNGPGKNLYDLNDTSIYGALDMFRYSTDPNSKAPGANPVLDLTVGTNSYFSVDGGATALFGNSFSTGRYNGDGQQASHWKEGNTCNGYAQLGILDPTVCFGQAGVVKALDLAAYDAMGWNTRVDVLQHSGYTASTASIYSTFVPEPSSWALMLGGFGMIGGVMRRRQRIAVSFG